MTMTGSHSDPRVHRLPESVVNQIAAGEVVERPASVIKELVENALDAGAKKIEVHLSHGGMSEIAVIDDGTGMGKEDLELCLERHTTSKISVAEDLEEIHSFGFRGEALSSIGSISELEVRTRTSSSTSALVKTCRFGELQETKPCSGPVGTRVRVLNIFQNTPARKKFLRAPSTELSHCTKVLKTLALGAPSTAFYLKHENKTTLKLLAGTAEQRVLTGLKPKWDPLHYQEQNDELGIETFLSPSHTIQNRGELFLYINGRAVRNRSLLMAIRTAYLDTLGPHHEPSGVVYLTLRGDWVDVNVHPQKWEVRCLRQESIHQWIRAAIRKAISKDRSVRSFTSPSTISTLRETIQVERPSPSPLIPMEFAPIPPTPTQITLDTAPRTSAPERVEREPEGLNPSPHRPIQYLGQAKSSYLVCDDGNGVVFVDQHALHEKMEFERLMKRFKEGPVQTQSLLVAKIVRLPEELIPVLEKNLQTFEKLGFEIELFGDSDIAVKAVPSIIEESKISAILEEALENLEHLEQSAEVAIERVVRPVFATIACHSVVRAGQSLSQEKAQSLLSGLDTLEAGWTCPHGRPVIFRLPFPILEKHFERG